MAKKGTGVIMIHGVNITPEGTKDYPLHRHDYWEVMFYISGKGRLVTQNEKIQFEKNTVIAVPPGYIHGSSSEAGFKNISVGADFYGIFTGNKPICYSAPEDSDAEKLAYMILRNFPQNMRYCSALEEAYAVCISLNFQKNDSDISKSAVDTIAESIMKNFGNPSLDTTELLIHSGFSEDYIRSKFKQITGFTPKAFLARQRILYAVKLCEIYGKKISVEKLSEMCGFSDSVYFSKKFKEQTGISPEHYINKK